LIFLTTDESYGNKAEVASPWWHHWKFTSIIIIIIIIINSAWPSFCG